MARGALIVPPGSAAERGAYGSVPAQPRASFVSGVGEEITRSGVAAAKEFEGSVKALAGEIMQRGQQIEEENLTRRIMEAKIEYGESLNKLMVDPDSGVLNRQGGDAIGSTREFGDRAAALINERLDGWSGRAKDTFEMAMRGVRADMVRAVATHEAKQRDVHADTLRDRAFEDLKSTAVMLGSQPDLGRVLDKIDLELRMIAPNVRGDSDAKGLWLQEARRTVVGEMLASRLKANPDLALDLVNSIHRGDGPVKETDLHENDLLNLGGLAREAYKGQVFTQAVNMVAHGGEESGLRLINDNPGLTEDEKRQGRGLVRSEATNVMVRQERAEKAQVERAADMIIRGNIAGQVFTPKAMLDAGVPARMIPHLMQVQGSMTEAKRENDLAVYVQARGLVDAGKITSPAGIAQYAVLNGRVLPVVELTAEGRKQATALLANLDDAHVEKLLGRLEHYGPGGAGGGGGGGSVRSNGEESFKALMAAKGLKLGDKEYAWALMAWQESADRLEKNLGRPLDTEEINRMNADLFSNVLIGKGWLGANTAPAYKVLAQVRSGQDVGLDLDVPKHARLAIEEDLRKRGITATDKQVAEIYYDPRNAGRFPEPPPEPEHDRPSVVGDFLKGLFLAGGPEPTPEQQKEMEEANRKAWLYWRRIEHSNPLSSSLHMFFIKLFGPEGFGSFSELDKRVWADFTMWARHRYPSAYANVTLGELREYDKVSPVKAKKIAAMIGMEDALNYARER